MSLLSFHSDPAIKEKYLARVRSHAAADEIVQGATGQGGKGCAVWCTLDKYDHGAYQAELGIPIIIARLEDRIFEGLTVADSKAFPLAFLSSVPVGKDLSVVWKRFFVWLLVDSADGVVQFAKSGAATAAIRNVASLIEDSITRTVGAEEFLAARRAAADAYVAAAAAAADAAVAAYAAAYAAYAAYAAADAAADAAAAAYAAAYAAYAAAYAADAAADAAAAADADADAGARSLSFKKMGNKLISLMGEC